MFVCNARYERELLGFQHLSQLDLEEVQLDRRKRAQANPKSAVVAIKVTLDLMLSGFTPGLCRANFSSAA